MQMAFIGRTKNLIGFNIILGELEKKGKNATGFSCPLRFLRAEAFAVFNGMGPTENQYCKISVHFG
jgi:hypothetical protein